MRVEGVAVVTGGASGIGEACCRELTARGARVVALDRDAAKAQALAQEIGARAYVVDVADEEALARVAARVEAEVGPVATLVNCAGVLQPPLRPSELPMALYDEVVRIDQRGTYLACVLFGRRMVERRAGAIVNIASITAMRSVPLHAYAPAKAAVVATTECLAAEWGPAGVRVNVVSPGFTRTPALQAAIDKGERDATALARTAALGRMVEPAEVAQAVAFLCSPLAAAITGVNLPVECGWLAATSWASHGGLRAPA
ncbi:MAG: SDR family oxidoreductase [Rhodoblastus sp.]|nr:MAG: SDR family oxidoreductase [Rhodoblastus sp.]